MSGILRLSHAEVRVPDLELALAYYVEVVGLVEVERHTDRVFLKGWDEHQHHSLILTSRSDIRAPEPWIQGTGSRPISMTSRVGWRALASRPPGTRRASSLRGRATSFGSGHRVGM